MAGATKSSRLHDFKVAEIRPNSLIDKTQSIINFAVISVPWMFPPVLVRSALCYLILFGAWFRPVGNRRAALSRQPVHAGQRKRPPSARRPPTRLPTIPTSRGNCTTLERCGQRRARQRGGAPHRAPGQGVLRAVEVRGRRGGQPRRVAPRCCPPPGNSRGKCRRILLWFEFEMPEVGIRVYTASIALRRDGSVLREIELPPFAPRAGEISASRRWPRFPPASPPPGPSTRKRRRSTSPTTPGASKSCGTTNRRCRGKARWSTCATST